MKLPHNIEIDPNKDYQPAEIAELAIHLLHSEIAYCINLIDRKRNEVVVRNDHPMVASGLREAAIALRKRARELGVPPELEDEMTTPIDPLPSGEISIDQE